MKDPNLVLREKELDIVRVRKEVEAQYECRIRQTENYNDCRKVSSAF